MSTPGFLFHFIFIAYIWQCVWYYFMGKYIQSVKELPFFSITMSLFFYMEAFNIYSQTVFEDKFLMRTLISFIMGFNFLILTIANRKLIWKKGDKHEQLLSEGDSVQTEIKEGLLNKKGYIKPNTKTKIIFALLV